MRSSYKNGIKVPLALNGDPFPDGKIERWKWKIERENGSEGGIKLRSFLGHRTLTTGISMILYSNSLIPSCTPTQGSQSKFLVRF